MRKFPLATIVGLSLACLVPQSLDAQTNAPRITAAGHSNGVFSLAWTNTGVNPVTVERRDSLTSGSWTAIASNNATGVHSDTNAPSGQAFYRVVMVAPPPNMALIPAGSFSMGNVLSASNDGDTDELPVHTVSVSAFYMDKYEVSKALWDEVASWAAANYYDINSASVSGNATNLPVYNLDWYEAVKWSNARSQKEGLTPCYTLDGVIYKTGVSDSVECNFAANGYRLPTEAEWEKAARGGLSGQRYPWGDTITHSEANYYSDSSYAYDVSPTRGGHPTYRGKPFSPVGSFAPNVYGLYDMVGNMVEWCWDWYSSSYYTGSPGSNPTGPASGSFRVVRGGSWNSRANDSRAAARTFSNQGIYGSLTIGFRSVRSSVP